MDSDNTDSILPLLVKLERLRRIEYSAAQAKSDVLRASEYEVRAQGIQLWVLGTDGRPTAARLVAREHVAAARADLLDAGYLVVRESVVDLTCLVIGDTWAE